MCKTPVTRKGCGSAGCSTIHCGHTCPGDGVEGMWKTQLGRSDFVVAESWGQTIFPAGTFDYLQKTRVEPVVEKKGRLTRHGFDIIVVCYLLGRKRL